MICRDVYIESIYSYIFIIQFFQYFANFHYFAFAQNDSCIWWGVPDELVGY